ncbi:E3 ubiquitin-protein ligase rnf213-alpha-like [Saccoglossus kowalevskii]
MEIRNKHVSTGQSGHVGHNLKDNDLNIADIHVAYHQVKRRLQYFSKLVNTFKSLLNKLIVTEQTDEMIIDVIALSYTLDMIVPETEELGKPTILKYWLNELLPSVTFVANQLLLLGNVGPKTKRILDQCRPKWDAMYVLRLFVDNLCSGEMDDGDVKTALAYFRVIKKKTNITKVNHMMIVEKLLNTCRFDAVRRYFVKDVPHCAFQPHDVVDPVVLKCQHLCCEKCFEILKTQEILECPIDDCREEFPPNATGTMKSRKDAELYKTHRKNCNLFLLEIISTFYLNFGENDTPDDEVWNKLQCNLRIQDGTLTISDPGKTSCNMNMSAFLVRLILRFRIDKVRPHLQKYMEQYLQLCSTPQEKNGVLSLFVNCIEDSFHKHGINTNDVYPLIDQSKPFTGVNVDDLLSIAAARYVLTRTADIIHDITNASMPSQLTGEIQSMLQHSKQILQITNSPQCSMFLLKCLCRRYNLGYLDKIPKDLEWIFPHTLQLCGSNTEIVKFDQFNITGDLYKKLKYTIHQLFEKQNNIDNVLHIIQHSDEPDIAKMSLILSIYSQVTLQYARDEPVNPEVVHMLVDMVQQDLYDYETQEIDLLLELLQNQQGFPNSFLEISPDLDRNERELISIITHMNALLVVTGKNSILQPLWNLMTKPSNLMGHYLPTMPDDEFFKTQSSVEGQWLCCGNRHTYYVQPNKTHPQRCPVCGIEKWRDDIQLQRDQFIVTGHNLGTPTTHEAIYPIRGIQPIPLVIMRLMTHVAMLLGSLSYAQVISEMIDGHASYIGEEGRVGDFLMKHIRLNVQMLSDAIGGSYDDAVMTIHFVLNVILKDISEDDDIYSLYPEMESQEDRAEWESIMVEKYIRPAIKNLHNTWEDLRGELFDDANSDQNAIYKSIFEHEINSSDIEEVSHNYAILWNYRPKVRFEQLAGLLENSNEHFPILEEFMKMNHYLQAVRLLPDIVHLQVELRRICHLKISEQEAEDTLICDFSAKNETNRPRLKFLVGSFCVAWRLMKNAIVHEGVGGIGIPKEYIADEVGLESPLSILLPSVSGRGRCSLALVDALITAQNMFLHKFAYIRGFKLSQERVKISDITTTDLINFDQEELEQMIMSHCNYLLEIGGDPILDYDFSAFERQIITKLIQGKPLIEREPISFVFSDSICDKQVFASLSRLIPQVEIPHRPQREIMVDIRNNLSLPDLCTSIRAIDLAIGFLNSSGGKKDMLIHQYLQDVLRLPVDDGLLSEKARKSSTLSHILSLWQLLVVEKAKQFINGNLDPFDDIDIRYIQQLPDDRVHSLKEILQRIDIIRLIRELFEFVHLELKSGLQTEITPDNIIRDCLNKFCEDKAVDIIKGIEKLPDELTMRHLVEFWKLANECHSDIERLGSTSE